MHGPASPSGSGWPTNIMIDAQRYGGQRIYIVPAYDLVVVATAGLYDDERQDSMSYNIFDKYVLAAVRN